MPAEHPITCEDIQPWLAAFAIGEAEDDAAARAHVASCERCQRDLAEYRGVVGLLAYDAPVVAPAPELRARIVAAVERETAVVTPRLASTRTAAPVPQQRRSARFTRPAWAAFAFAALAVAMLVWNISLQRTIADQNSQLAFHRESWQTMTVLLNDTTVVSYAMAGQGATGHVWVTPQGEAACVVVQQLPDVADNQTYQVWMTHGGEVVSGGTFPVHDGNGWALAYTDEPLANYDSVFVTVEPSGGSAAPTGPHVLDTSLKLAIHPSASERQQVLNWLNGELTQNS